MSGAVGVAIIGAGAIAAHHAQAYLATGARVIGVMSTHLADAERLGRQVGAEVVVTQLEPLWAHPGVQAVDICTPTDSHAAIALAAARAGRHVHVEKPMALTLADADAIISACDAAGVKLMVGQTARYQAVHRTIKSVLAAGDIGRPFHLEIAWSHGTFWPGGWRGWQIDPARSGGHLVHNGVHVFDVACWLLDDRPVRVFARARSVADAALGMHDYWHALVEFESGATALCEVGYVLRPIGAVHRETSVFGTRGSACHTTTDDGVIFADGGATSAGLVGADALRIQIAEWVAALAEDRPPPISGATGRRALAVGLAAQLSADSGAPVEVTS